MKSEGLVVCDSSGCCGPYRARPVTLGWEPPTDDHAPEFVRYNVYRKNDDNGELSAIARFISGEQFEGAVLCYGFPPEVAGTVRPIGMRVEPGTYVVRAVDAAGNEDENAAALAVPASCSDIDEDGGAPTPTGTDGGISTTGADEGTPATGTDRGAPTARAASGCALSRQRRSGAASIVGLIAMLSTAWVARFSRRHKGRGRRV